MHRPMQKILSRYIKATEINGLFSTKNSGKNMFILTKSRKATHAVIRPQCTVTNIYRELHSKKLDKCKFEENIILVIE